MCRSLETDETGELTIHNVVEILPVDNVPAEVGPLTFLALVRGLPEGPSKGAFLLQAPGPEGQGGRLPFEAEVPAGVMQRQMAMQITVPKLPVAAAGWFHIGFEWDGHILGQNKFLVGVMGASD